MSEFIRDYEQGEQRLEDIIERFRNTPLSTQEVSSAYGLDESDRSKEAEAILVEQRNLFLSGEIRNPDLVYPILEDLTPRLEEEEKLILDLMAESTELAFDNDRETAVYDLLRLRYLEVKMLQMTSQINSNKLSPEAKKEIADYFCMADQEVNGEMDRGYFAGLLIPLIEKAQKIQEDPDATQEAKDWATYLLQSTAIPEGIAAKPAIKPSKETIDTLQALIREIFSDITECVPDKPDDEKLSIGELASAFEKAHEARNTGWSTRIQTGQNGVESRQSDKTTVIGADRKLPTVEEARALLIHENGVHVERRSNGDTSGDTLLEGLGLPGYLTSEEGLTTISQRAYLGKNSTPGIPYYLVIGWANGLDGQIRDFRDVYELDWRRQAVEKYARKGEVTEVEIQKFKKKAYDDCVRIFRGTACDVPGMVYTKDKVYFEGSQRMWPLIEAIASLPEDDGKTEYNKLLSAKYDPTNPLHVRIVEKAASKRSEL